MQKKNQNNEIAGLLIMLSSAFIKHKPTQAKVFGDGLLISFGQDPAKLKDIAADIKKQKDHDANIIDIEYQEVKD